MKLSMVVPAIAAGWLVVVGGSLQVIVARSPYTHGNLSPQPDPAYVRTAQTTVGAPVPFQGMGMAQPMAMSDPLVRGRLLMIADSCATCHGVDGRGGPVGPSIAGTAPSRLRTMTSRGSGGMPVYGSGALSDDDLAAIAAYLATQVPPKATATPAH